MKKKEKINRYGKNKWVVVLFLFFFPFLCSPNLSFAFPEKEAEAVWQSTDKKVTLKMTGKTLAHILSGISADGTFLRFPRHSGCSPKRSLFDRREKCQR